MSPKRCTKQELRALAMARLAQPISKYGDLAAVEFKAGIIMAVGAAAEQMDQERAA